MIEQVSRFIDYFEGVRKRTLNYLRIIPPDQLDWSPRPGEFTCADIIKHLASAELLFVGAAIDGRWKYVEYDSSQGESLDVLLAQLADTHIQAMTRLQTFPDIELTQERPSLNGPQLKAWRLLMALVEHEIHHRSQLAMYLTLMGVPPPQIFGLGVEEVIARATG